MSNKDSLANYSSAGHRLSNIDYIDAHYVVSRKSYEAMLRAVGLQPGWNVLDAGCGSGSFLPLMAKLVGQNGTIDAFDLAPENIERVKTIVKAWDVPVKTKVGNLIDLPYDDNTFDAIWNASVIQYLADDELTQMLKELVRVVKPGGLVAIKEFDFTTPQYYPLDPFVLWRFEEKFSQANPGAFKALGLSGWCKTAGLIEIRQEIFWEEIRAPLPDYAHDFLAGLLQFYAKEAEGFMLSESDLQQWRRCQDPASLDNPVNHPEFYYHESHMLIVGKKPPAS